jgi:peptidoglycan/xylan/chitin deacetylase (PgdA/CDA1 family)
MKVVSPLLKRVVYPSLARAGVFRRTCGTGLAVLTYHGILPRGYRLIDSGFDGNLICADIFRRQLILLKKNYSVISPEHVLAWCEGRAVLPERAILLTCDDGLLNNLTEMLPVLQQEGVECLFFVTGASTGEARRTLWYEDLFLIFFRAPTGPFEISRRDLKIAGELTTKERRRSVWWNAVKRLSQVDDETRSGFLQAARLALGVEPAEQRDDSVAEQRFGLLVRDELRALLAAGMTIGAHTLNHPMLSQCPAAIARAEIVESRASLEVAYPFGDQESVTPEVMEMAKDAGYKAAFMNFGGGLGSPLPLHSLPRIHVTSQMSLAELEANVAGFYETLQRRVGRGQRLPLAARG